MCFCGKKYVGETIRNSVTRWKEHEDVKGDSEPAKHLYEDPDHSFVWKILSNAPKRKKDRKYLEANLISIKKPVLNNQVKSKTLSLFRNGIT